jgi:hypothetical protein
MDPNFGTDNVSILLLSNERSQVVESGASISYTITASSSQVEIEYQERTRFQLVTPYNLQINISISACLCGQCAIPTIIQLNYYSK